MRAGFLEATTARNAFATCGTAALSNMPLRLKQPCLPALVLVVVDLALVAGQPGNSYATYNQQAVTSQTVTSDVVVPSPLPTTIPTATLGASGNASQGLGAIPSALADPRNLYNPPVSLYLVSLLVQNATIDKAGAALNVTCQDDAGTQVESVNVPVGTADVHSTGFVKYSTLDSYVGQISYRGKFTCRLSISYIESGFVQQASLVEPGNSSCWFYYDYYNLQATTVKPASNWSCTSGGVNYVLGCHDCLAPDPGLAAAPVTDVRASQRGWRMLSSVAALVAVVVSVCGAIMLVILLCYCSKKRRIQQEVAVVIARRGPEDRVEDFNLHPPNFITARSPSDSKKQGINPGGAGWVKGPVVILNYGADSTPTANFHKGTIELGAPEAAEESYDDARQDGKRKRQSRSSAAYGIGATDNLTADGRLPSLSRKAAMARMERASPQAWVVKVDDMGKIADVEVVAPQPASPARTGRLEPAASILPRLVPFQLSPVVSMASSTSAGGPPASPGAVQAQAAIGTLDRVRSTVAELERSLSVSPRARSVDEPQQPAGAAHPHGQQQHSLAEAHGHSDAGLDIIVDTCRETRLPAAEA